MCKGSAAKLIWIVRASVGWAKAQSAVPTRHHRRGGSRGLRCADRMPFSPRSRGQRRHREERCDEAIQILQARRLTTRFASGAIRNSYGNGQTALDRFCGAGALRRKGEGTMQEASGTAGIIAENLLHEVLAAWRDRNERNAVKEAKVLTFWRDGMLRQLSEIAEDSATAKTYEDLKKNFTATAKPASKAMEGLTRLRGKVVNQRIADQIDKIVNDPAFGKNMIRYNIETILAEEGQAFGWGRFAICFGPWQERQLPDAGIADARPR